MSMNSNLQIYRNCEPVANTWYDPGGEQSIIETLVDALAAVAGVSVTEFPPLYETIDTDALVDLFDRDPGVTELVLGFTVESWNVFVRSDGRIQICDGTRETDPEPVFDETPA